MTAAFFDGADKPTEVPLKRRLKRAERSRQFKALALVLPLLLFLLLTFLGPLAGMLWRSVDDWEVRQVLPHTVTALADWDGKDVPDEKAYAALAGDILAARTSGTVAIASKRLNYALNGFRTILASTARNLKAAPEPGTAKETLVRINPAWGERASWAAIKGASGPVTGFYLLAALDLTRNVDNAIVAAPPDQAIYRDVFARTFTISFGVTVLCLILGFPVAYLLAALPAGRSNLLMIFVLLPFWTSLLVRTCAWIVLLQREGVVNNSLRWLGIVDEPLRLIYNRFGVYVAMTHVLLPFMILPLYSSMKAISPAYMRAAASLGASPVTAFAAGLPAADAAGYWGGMPARLHPGARLLHHAGTRRRRRRPDDQLFHRPLHNRNGQLGHGLGAGCGAAARHPAAGRRLRQTGPWPASHGRNEELSGNPSPRTLSQRIAWTATIIASTLVFVFLMTPILAIMPLSFSSGSYLTYPLPGLSLRWYEDFVSSPRWMTSLKNSMIIGVASTTLSMVLGTLAALGLAQWKSKFKPLVLAVVLSPVVVPGVITAVGLYFFFAPIGLTGSYLGLILAHTALATPFVVIPVSATLQSFDTNLARAAASLGASPFYAFRRVILPLILPGLASGALFAFATSFDEVVIVLFMAGPEQRTLPREMFSGIRENISPTITAAAVILTTVSVIMLATMEGLRRRNERLKGNNA